MSDEANPTTPQATSTPAAPAPQPASALTPEIQAMIEDARKQAFDSGAASVRRALEGKLRGQAPQPAPQPQAAPQASAPAAPSVDYQALRSFDRAMRRFDLSDDALAVVEEDFARANPSDPAAWVTSRASAYGWRQHGVTQTAMSTPSPATAPASATPMPGSTPPATPVLTADTPIMTLLRADPTQVDRLAQELGPSKFSARMIDEWRRTGQRVKVR